MDFPFFSGHRQEPASADLLQSIPPSRFKEEIDPQNYTTDPALANAANIAILMGKPLLLTGEPGTGKTQFAARLAWELGQMALFKFEAKSNSKASDLFYFFNMVGYFQSAQTKKPTAAKEFITYNALGQAILRTLPPEQYQHLVPQIFEGGQQFRSVVLIDEIDKAPRDFPNDILNELEGLYFRIPELENQLVTAEPALAPIVVITSNSERNLPETFLRRCIYHHIVFPDDREKLTAIVAKRLGATILPQSLFLDAIDVFLNLRATDGLMKKPTIGELLLWLQAIKGVARENPPERLSPELATQTLGVLIKNKEDLDLVKATQSSWEPISND